MVEECVLRQQDLVLPVFVSHDKNPVEISSMPGVYRWPLESLESQAKEWYESGIRSLAIFPKIDFSCKDDGGQEILNPSSLAYQAAASLRQLDMDFVLFADLALDPYTRHGHDGILDSQGKVDNDETVEILAKASLLCAQAGFDWVSPSDMMDGRIGVIRDLLDQNGHEDIGILSYSAKFASSYYGPFRDAIGAASASGFIDKTSYQLNPANRTQAYRELFLDFEEGADILMVKPAEPFLDIIKYASENFHLPIAAYQTSGEYSRIMAADKLGWLDGTKCALESLLSIKRAGADLIFTYFADRIIKLLQ